MTEEQLLAAWRACYANPRAFTAWRNDAGDDSAACAFNAVAQDPSVLTKADRADAARLATQALDFTTTLLARHRQNEWWAAARVVECAVSAWTQGLPLPTVPLPAGTMQRIAAPNVARPDAPTLEQKAAASAARREQALWDTARRTFPVFDDDTGRLTADTILRLGTDLSSLHRPWDRIVVLGALRFAAGSARATTAARGTLKVSRPLAQSEILLVLRNAYAHIAVSHAQPFLVRYDGGPAAHVAQALGLMQDAMTLDQVQRRAAADGHLAASSLFRRAAGHHAFAALALDRTMLARHDVESARTISEAALDFITAAATGEVDMPLFDPGFTPNIQDIARAARSRAL
jgi:hypothetical protein